MTGRQKYGLQFGGNYSDFDIERYCFAKNHKASDGGKGRYLHFKNASKILWPDMIWHDWSKDRIKALCEYPTNAWTGCAASGKSFDSAHFAMLWWSVEPKNSTVILTSTTGKMVRKRVWPALQGLYHACVKVPDCDLFCNGFPGNLVDSKTTLQAEKGDDRNGLFALAVREGPASKAVAEIQGLHNDRMLVIIDEATDTPEAIFEAIPNLRKGCSEFMVLAIGNPVSHMDPHGLLCEPAKGWGRINIEDDEWETKGVTKWEIDPGICLHFDGLKSPNIKEGHKKYSFLISQDDVDRARRIEDGEHSIGFWKFTRGFWPPEGICNTIFSEAMVERLDGRGKHTFHSKKIEIAALDPAFGGDRCKLKFGTVGDLDASGRMGLQIGESHDIVPKARSTKELDYQIAHQVMDKCKEKGVQPQHFAMDATGIGRGVAAIISEEWSPEIIRIEFGDKASEKPASTDDPRPGSEVYDRRVTELWFAVREILQSQQLKGLKNDEIIEFCNREYTHEKKKIRLSTKDECKKNIGKSPDNADCIAIMVDLAKRLGVVANFARNENEARTILKIAQKAHEVYDDDNDSVESPFSHNQAFATADLGWD